MTFMDEVYWGSLLAFKLLMYGFIIWWGAQYFYGVDLRKRREAQWSWKEILPGPAGRRARVERKYLKIRSPNYHRVEKKVRIRRIFKINLSKIIKR